MRSPDIWAERGVAARFFVMILTPLSLPYAFSVALRARYTHTHRSRAKVVCIGNLTAGGTGKTPIAREIALSLIARGVRPVFLSRGYGGKQRGPVLVRPEHTAIDVGDEPLLLTKTAPVIVSRDRAAGARLADKHNFDVIVMDDGHQNFALKKDLSLVVIDAELGFGNNRVLPAGPLREPVAAGLRRADAIIINGEGTAPSPIVSDIPLLRSHVLPVDATSLPTSRVLAFAGIGRPEKFFALLAANGVEVVERRSFADHHAFTPLEISQLRARARSLGAALVTTEKDFVRLVSDERRDISYLPVRIKFNDQETLEHLLDRLVPRALPLRSQ